MCGVLVYIVDGKVTKIEGDPELAKGYPLVFTSWKQVWYWHSGNSGFRTGDIAYLTGMLVINIIYKIHK